MTAIGTKALHPRAVMSPPPREVVRYRGMRVPVRMFLFMLIPHVWVGLGIIVFVMGQAALTMLGHRTTGTVTNRQVERVKGMPHRIFYTYEEAGQSYRDNEKVSPDDWDRMAVGARVAVRSLHVFGLGGSELANVAEVGVPPWLVVIIFAIGWNVFIWWTFCAWCVTPLRQKRMVRLAEAVPGRVTKKFQNPRRTRYYVGFCYTAPDGRFTSDHCMVRRAQYEAIQEGNAVNVLCAALSVGRKSIVYEFADYRVRE